MSVYTKVDRDQLRKFLSAYDIGELTAFEGIRGGIENTNYFVDTTGGRYVLTLVEQWPASAVPYFLSLMAWLEVRGFPCARPIAGRDGGTLRTLCGKPAALVQRLGGASIEQPGLREQRAVGRTLAELHTKSNGFGDTREDMRGASWRDATARRVLERHELLFQAEADRSASAIGVIHADLFRDNVLFEDGEVSGVIDFYYACNARFVYDLAISVNDWCSLEDGALDANACHTLLGAYQAVRELDAEERALWPAMLRAAALRFWLSRLHDHLYPREGVLITVKDPLEFERILRHRREHSSIIREAIT